MKTRLIHFLIVCFIPVFSLFSQNPVSLEETFPEFQLMSYQGEEVTLADLEGKNVMMIFVRGRVGDHWCQICHYQYSEWAEIEEQMKLSKKYNLEIVFVLPYSMEMVEEWATIFPEQQAVIYGWKNPDDPENLSAGMKNWMEKCRIIFPKDFDYSEGVPTPFPILADPDRKLSMELGLFTTFWDRSYVEQNIPTIYLLDENGKVRFKYISQTTFDRPSTEYMLDMMEKLL